MVGAVIAGLVRLALVVQITRRHFDAATSLSAIIASSMTPLACGLLVSWLWYGAGIVSAHTWVSLGFIYALIASSVALASTAVTCITSSGRSLVFNTLRTARNMILRRA